MAGTRISALTETTSIAAADVLPLAVVASSVNRKMTFANLQASITGAYKTIATSKYTSTPASTSSITMSDTSDVAVGLPIRFTGGGTTYYALITAVTASTSITITGAPLTASASWLTALAVGPPEKVIQRDFSVAGTEIVGTWNVPPFPRWRGPKAYAVTWSAIQRIARTGTSDTFNLTINSSNVGTSALAMSATNNTWVTNSAVAVNTSNYDINLDENINVVNSTVGTGTAGADFTIVVTFVLE